MTQPSAEQPSEHPGEQAPGTPQMPVPPQYQPVPPAGQYQQPAPPYQKYPPAPQQYQAPGPQQQFHGQYPMSQQPPMPTPGYGYGYPQPKSKLAAGLFGIFLGGLGIHRFYLGYTTIGVVQLVLTVVLGIFTLGLVGLWGFIEGIMILAGGSYFQRDARGVPLRD